ncbi:AAA family ATPase [Phytoactinopolyspora halotolerans]|uniref:ATP-binding protein n=1 Tax=Phytoactinopolyspora halotolerans TaxID=1981512 RepID=A0A6L9SHI0_9ACTN|nr:ATP-binding protein [Phytoactinopolyspora halotolerans]NEE04587.1 ATP-binding protein [Phytoactinopolyspora halotolerans]
MDKPLGMFDREHEWSALTRFASDEQPGATLGVVSGRRRQGKTFLLDALCRTMDGFYFGAVEETEAESLRRIGHALTDFLDLPVTFRPDSWYEVIDTLLTVGRERPVPVVIDEFPYLVKASPALPSIIQQAYGPLRDERVESRSRLLLCGSALSVMGKLLSGNAPLRGRASLELVVRTLDHRLAAEFWGIDDHRLAVQVNAILGGTPAYRRELARNDVPAGQDDFDDWVVRTVLSTDSPLFREARYLLAEEPDLRDSALYHAVLAAVAGGNANRGGIADYLERKSSDLAHSLDVLEGAGLLVREQDAFRAKRSTYRITEPLITFYHAVMRPAWDQLERPGNAERVWRNSQRRFVSNVLGPRFEQICREWALFHADDDVLGGLSAQVGHGVVSDPTQRTTHEIDVVVTGTADGNKPPLLAIGEVQWGEVMGIEHLDRLRHVASLLAKNDRYDASQLRILCFSAAGFSPELHEAEGAGQVVLVGLDKLYG